MTRTRKFDPNKYDECPRCGRYYEKGSHAVSRRDNATAICNQCGNDEAFIDAGYKPADKLELDFLLKIGKG